MSITNVGTVVCLLGVGTCIASATTYRFFDLNPSGYESSEAAGISDGIVAGDGVPMGGTLREPLLWPAPSPQVLSLLPNGYQTAVLVGAGGDAQVGEAYTNSILTTATPWYGEEVRQARLI